MKIVMVGPVYPYKGGIAHYMGMMCKTFAKKHEVIALSYNCLLYTSDAADEL